MKKSNGAALIPIYVFLVLYLGLGILFEYVLKIPMGFYNIPIVVAFMVEGADSAGIAAVGAEGPAVLRGDALLEDHFLVHGLLILLLGQIALGEHFGQNVQLAVPVPTGTVPLLPLVLKDVGGIGVKK